jgi:hypothetical protein
MGKKVVGSCAICGELKTLSNEHFPPKGAFNRDSVKVQSINEYKTKVEVVWTEKWKHGGNAKYRTCVDCNTKTGDWYARGYIDFVTKIEPYARPKNMGIGELDLVDIYPMRVVKQVLCSILASSNLDESIKPKSYCAPSAKDEMPPPAFLMDTRRAYEVLPDLRRLILDKNATGLPQGVRLYLYLVANRAGRTSGIGVTASKSKGKAALFAELAWWPVGWALFFDGDLWKPLLDVTEWMNVGYDFKVPSMTLGLPCYWIEGKFPLDFRTPEEVAAGEAQQLES